MATMSGLKIGSCLLAIALFAGLMMRAGFAEEPGSGARDDRKASNPSAAPNGSQPPSSEDAASGSSGKNSDPIDTSMSVPPRRLGAKPGKVGEAKGKVELPAVRNLHRRTFSASRASNQTVRNAIGAPVAQRESAERLGSEHVGLPIPPHVPAAGTIGTVGNAIGDLARREGNLDRPNSLRLNATPIVRPTVWSRAAINGTNLNRRGVGASSVGGPAKTVAGINGTMVRPAH